MLEGFAGHIRAVFAHIGDDHAGVGDGDGGHLLHLHGGEARVDEVAAGQHHLFLAALVAAMIDEGLRVLEHVVAGDFFAGDFTGGQLLAFLGGDDAHHVVADIGEGFFGDSEQCRVDAVGAGRDDGQLCAAFAAFGQKGTGILKSVTSDLFAQDAAVGERVAVAGFHHAHRVLADGDEPLHDHFVLPRPVAEVQARGQGVGLVAGFAVQGDDLAVGQGSVGADQHEFFVEDADAILGNHDHAKQAQNQFVEDNEQNRRNDEPKKVRVVAKHGRIPEGGGR